MGKKPKGYWKRYEKTAVNYPEVLIEVFKRVCKEVGRGNSVKSRSFSTLIAT